MRILHLYRPSLPGLRAQAIQVVHTCHALALRGHEVTLLADRAPGAGTAAGALRALGLAPHPRLDLRLAPLRQRGLAGLWFRRALAGWWAGPPGVVLARDKGRLVAAARHHPRRHRVVLESHELDSLLAEEAGREAGAVRALEADAARVADALVTNCGGTLAAWEGAGLDLPERRAVVHNGTAVRPLPGSAPSPVIRCVGSLRAYKGVEDIRAAAPSLPLPLHWTGGTAAERASQAPVENLHLEPPVPHPEVAALLADAQVVLVPLADNVFGRQLTSPLKLWDALAAGRPVVAPDLPTVREVAALASRPLYTWAPGDPAGLAAAVEQARRAPTPAPFVRSWDARAAALEAVFEQLEAP